MELQGYHTTITEAWQLFKQHYPPRADQEYWDELIKNADRFGTKSKFARKMAVVIVNELERIQKSGDVTEAAN